MAIINRFTPADMDFYTKLVDDVYLEKKKALTKVLRLKPVPDVLLKFEMDTEAEKMGLSWATHDMEVEGEWIKRVFMDNIYLEIGPIWSYLAKFKLDRLPAEKFAQCFKEFVGVHIVQHFIQARDIQYNYKGFRGRRADTDPNILFKPLYIHAATGYYYSKLITTYDEHMMHNVLGGHFARLLSEMVDYLSEHKTARDIEKDETIDNRLHEIKICLGVAFPTM